ncbi:MAG TPA: 4-coumarate--CoA ligase family protein [Pyrinomonadaceae bacterium]|nr:4-coumarate--CoA ligase family protein [Pyrinomonadaceae bacterium]
MVLFPFSPLNNYLQAGSLQHGEQLYTFCRVVVTLVMYALAFPSRSDDSKSPALGDELCANNPNPDEAKTQTFIMIFRGPFPDVDIPEVSLTEFVLSRAEERGDKPALIEGPTGRIVTYAGLLKSIRRVAASLAARGFKKGEVFGILSPNVPEYAMVFHGVALLGGIVSPVNPLYTDNEIGHQLKDAGARFLFTVPQFLDKAREAAKEAGIEEIFVLGEAEGATPFATLIENDGEVPDVKIDPREDLVALPYSSGTTGLPKGVMLTHHNLVSNLCQMQGLDYFTEDDTLICVLPLFHIYGLVVILNMGLWTGATIVTMPRFDLEQFLKLVQNYGVTMAHIVPPIVLALSNSPLIDEYDLSKLHTLFSGAAPLGEPLTKLCMERLNCRIRQGYGMTETSPVTHSSPSDPAVVKFGSVGVPAPNTECKIVSLETGEAQSPRNEGEICVRGPQIMKGYLNKPDATAITIDADGWLHTGDVGYADEDGHFFIVDRAKELIKYKGFQVAPAELEAILLTHPSIADVAVIPCLDDEAGEVPKAYVVRTDDVSAATIMDFLAEEVAPYKKLRFVEFIDKIPKSASGKILRRVLIAQDRAKPAP